MWWSRFKNLRALTRTLKEQAETIDRLEIAQRRDRLKHNELATDLERLSDRLCAMQGRALGGGRGRPRKPNGQTELNLEEIPHGDKAALRAYFLKHPPKDDTEH
jgi:hypothetical protein